MKSKIFHTDASLQNLQFYSMWYIDSSYRNDNAGVPKGLFVCGKYALTLRYKRLNHQPLVRKRGGVWQKELKTAPNCFIYFRWLQSTDCCFCTIIIGFSHIILDVAKAKSRLLLLFRRLKPTVMVAPICVWYLCSKRDAINRVSTLSTLFLYIVVHCLPY